MYELLTQDQMAAWTAARAKPKALKRRDDVDHFVNMSESTTAVQLRNEHFLALCCILM
jgi:hypothetical protein